jgi:transketolase
VVDGHDVLAVQKALQLMKSRRQGPPKALIARTIKGRGVPGMENAPLSHVMSLKPEVIDKLLEEKS